jgi:hypothetical protein
MLGCVGVQRGRCLLEGGGRCKCRQTLKVGQFTGKLT